MELTEPLREYLGWLEQAAAWAKFGGQSVNDIVAVYMASMDTAKRRRVRAYIAYGHLLDWPVGTGLLDETDERTYDLIRDMAEKIVALSDEQDGDSDASLSVMLAHAVREYIEATPDKPLASVAARGDRP